MSANNILIPVIRTALPSLIAQQIVGVQPMTATMSMWGATHFDLKIPYAVHPRYKFSRKWHIHRINYDRSGDEVYRWCEEAFGPHPKNPDAWCRWYRHSTRQFYFKDQDDYLLFKLKYQ